MARGPVVNPIAKAVPWAQRTTCPECGFRIRSPRPNDEKRCSRCREVLHTSEFPHNPAKNDHREAYCKPCKRDIQNEANRKNRLRGKPQPISDLWDGEQTTTLIGQFVSQSLLSEWKDMPTALEPVQVQYRTLQGRQDVYELVLQPTDRPTGTAADNIGVPHTFKELFDAPLEAGDWIGVVFQDGQVEKVVRLGDEGPIVDTSLDFTLDENAPPGARFGSYAPARPWSLGLAVDLILDEKPKPTGGCLLCGNPQGEVEDFTLSCPDCTHGLRYSAELLLADLYEPEIVFAVLSRLETDWLLSQIPKEVEVPA